MITSDPYLWCKLVLLWQIFIAALEHQVVFWEVELSKLSSFDCDVLALNLFEDQLLPLRWDFVINEFFIVAEERGRISKEGVKEVVLLDAVHEKLSKASEVLWLRDLLRVLSLLRL